MRVGTQLVLSEINPCLLPELCFPTSLGNPVTKT